MNDDTTSQNLGTEQAADLAELHAMADQQPEPGQEQAAPPADRIPTADMLAPVVTMLCNTVAPAWAIPETEQLALAGAYAAIIDKYYPDGVEFGPELSAVIITAGVIVPRLGKPLRIEHEKTEDAHAAAA